MATAADSDVDDMTTTTTMAMMCSPDRVIVINDPVSPAVVYPVVVVLRPISRANRMNNYEKLL